MFIRRDILVVVVAFQICASCISRAQTSSPEKGETDCVEASNRLEMLHRSIYSATSWNMLVEETKEYRSVVRSMADDKERLMKCIAPVLKSESDNNCICFLRSMRILGVRPQMPAMLSIVELLQSRNDAIVEEAALALIALNSEVSKSDILSLLSNQSPRVKAAGVKLVCQWYLVDLSDAIAETLHDPLMVEDFGAGDVSTARDLREEILLSLGRCRLYSDSLDVESHKLQNSESPPLRAAALSYRCAITRSKNSTDEACAALRTMATSSDLFVRINAIRCSILARALSPEEEYELLRKETLVTPPELRGRVTVLLRHLSWQDSDRFQQLLDKVIASATAEEMYHLTRELEHIPINGENLRALARRLAMGKNIGAYLACRSALISLVRSAWPIPQESIVEFKNNLQQESQCDVVRSEFKSVETSEIQSTRSIFAQIQ